MSCVKREKEYKFLVLLFPEFEKLTELSTRILPYTYKNCQFLAEKRFIQLANNPLNSCLCDLYSDYSFRD